MAKQKSRKIFILEDEIDGYRHPIRDILVKGGHHLTICKSVPDAKRMFEGPYDLLLLDHDMAGFYEKSSHPNTGFQFVKWLIEQDPKPKPEVVCHSQNTVGRQNMVSLLAQHGYDVSECAYGTEYLKQLREQLG